MKKYILLFIAIIGLSTQFSCTDYLDKAPESGLSEEDVFTKHVNFKKFFYTVYGGKENKNITCAHALSMANWDQRYGLEALTELADNGRLLGGQRIKGGVMGTDINFFTYQTSATRRPILDAMFKVIRVSNIALEKVDQIKDATQEDIEDLRGQAYFIRGYAHFVLNRYWGPMPYLNQSIGAYDEWDIPRLSKNESLRCVALDMDSAFVAFEKAGKIRRDPGPGEPGHLNDPDLEKPNGVAAKAMKARALLYAASPLNNANGSKDWEDAAVASWEAIQLAQKYQYALIDGDRYTDNMYGVKYTNEQIWAWHAGNKNYGNAPTALQNGIFSNKKTIVSGENPTQNFVDMFETQWGDPLNTEEDRKEAIKLGHYNEQDPYVNRDPRFYHCVIYNQANIIWAKVADGEVKNKANIYYENDNGKFKYSTLLDQSYAGVSHTGYYTRKYFGDMSVQNQVNTLTTDPLIRLTELYLNYAEATNEAYGPSGKAPGASMSAIDAINLIRERVDMVPVKSIYTKDTETFRKHIKNERTIELYGEGHHYFDIRRWKDAPVIMSTKLYGMDIEKVEKSAEYPTGFKYTRQPLEEGRQVRWHDAMYYFPFHSDDYYKLKNFDTSLNPIW